MKEFTVTNYWTKKVTSFTANNKKDATKLLKEDLLTNHMDAIDDLGILKLKKCVHSYKAIVDLVWAWQIEISIDYFPAELTLENS